MDFTQVPTVVAIIVITYLIGYTSKQIPQVKDNIIPVIVGVAGGILGIVGMFVIPNYPADNILDAIAVGIVSGMASTGVNQIYKQVKKNAWYKQAVNEVFAARARITIYERDDEGNILYEGYTDSDGNFVPYLDDDGNKIPKIIEEKVGFSKPADFRANIAFSGGEAKTEEFGFDAADYDAIMLTDKNEFPLKKVT